MLDEVLEADIPIFKNLMSIQFLQLHHADQNFRVVGFGLSDKRVDLDYQLLDHIFLW